MSPEMGRAEDVARKIKTELEKHGLVKEPLGVDIVEPPILFALQKEGIKVVDGQQIMSDARVIKTIGDEVMVVGTDPAALVDWAVGFQQLATERPRPRIGLHAGSVLYRDGDYYGRAVNLASRVAARATGGEVLVTREIRAAAGRHLVLEPIGSVELKGFDDATELFLAAPR